MTAARSPRADDSPAAHVDEACATTGILVFDEYEDNFPAGGLGSDLPATRTVGVTLPRRCSIVTEANQTSARGESCPDCHALVVDLDAHKRWHSRLVSDLAHAVESEIVRKQAGRA